MEPDEVMTAYQAAARAKDLAGCAALLAEDAMFFFSNRAAHLGKPAVLEALRANFAAIANDTYAVEDLTWLARTSEAAVCVYGFRWSGEVGGQPVSGSGRGTSALRRDGGGWRIVHEHLSPGPYRRA